MKCRNCFLGEIRKYIRMLSAENFTQHSKYLMLNKIRVQVKSSLQMAIYICMF